MNNNIRETDDFEREDAQKEVVSAGAANGTLPLAFFPIWIHVCLIRWKRKGLNTKSLGYFFKMADKITGWNISLDNNFYFGDIYACDSGHISSFNSLYCSKCGSNLYKVGDAKFYKTDTFLLRGFFRHYNELILIGNKFLKEYFNADFYNQGIIYPKDYDVKPTYIEFFKVTMPLSPSFLLEKFFQNTLINEYEVITDEKKEE